MRRILYYSLLCLLWVSVNSCNDDDTAQPPTPSFDVDRQTGLYNSTEFVFTVEQIGSNSMALLPYGIDHPNDPGILIPSTSFTNGKATVKFIYAKVGTFQAVVVANNHTGGGEGVKNTYSSAKAITITSNRAAFIDFTFDGANSTTIDTTARTIDVVVPFGTALNGLKAKYTTSDFATVTVGGTDQTSGETANDFTSDKTYVVKSQDGLQTESWTVHVDVVPVETTNMFKSFAGIDSRKAMNGRALPADLDSANNQIVIYDTLGTTIASEDSIAIDFALKGKFALAKIGNDTIATKDTLNFSGTGSTPIVIKVVPQDAGAAAPDGIKTFNTYFRTAPRLTAMLTDDSNGPLNPMVTGTASEFALGLSVLKGTDVTEIFTTFSFDLPAGATTGAIMVDGAAFTNGDDIDYTKPVTVKVEVTEGGITFWAAYVVTVTAVK